MARSISNSDDIIDSRDVIARIEELQGERDSWPIEGDEAEGAEQRRAELWATDNPDDAAELTALEVLQEDAEGYAPDWRHGSTLISDSYFEEYAQELAEDIGAIPKDAAWPACHIDWTAAAEALQQDYTQVDFDGEAYWIR